MNLLTLFKRATRYYPSPLQEGLARDLLRLYRQIERKETPTLFQLLKIASTLKTWYTEELPYLEELNISAGTLEQMTYDYEKRLEELENALSSRNHSDLLIAIDNAINQWHYDYPVIWHMTYRDTPMPPIFLEIFKILMGLGRIPKVSPYKPKDQTDPLEKLFKL